jgi:hypothetical protein
MLLMLVSVSRVIFCACMVDSTTRDDFVSDRTYATASRHSAVNFAVIIMWKHGRTTIIGACGNRVIVVVCRSPWNASSLKILNPTCGKFGFFGDMPNVLNAVNFVDLKPTAIDFSFDAVPAYGSRSVGFPVSVWSRKLSKSGRKRLASCSDDLLLHTV